MAIFGHNGLLSKAYKKVKSYASGLLKPIDDKLGTDFTHIDDRNAQTDEANSARAFEAQQKALDRNFNAEEAEKNRQWQEEMSNTAHQRQVADLQAAGINPVLAAGGNGAMTTTGATASSTGTSAPITTLPPSTARKMHALEMLKTLAEIENTKAEEKNTNKATEIMDETGTYPGMPTESETSSWNGGAFGFNTGRSVTNTGPANRKNKGNQTQNKRETTAKQKEMNEKQKREWKIY